MLTALSETMMTRYYLNIILDLARSKHDILAAMRRVPGDENEYWC